MDPYTENPFRDIFDNALDIFSSEHDLDFDIPPPSPPLAEGPLQSQMLFSGPLSMLLPPEAVYKSAAEAEEAIQSWAAEYNYTFFKRCSKLYNTNNWKKYI
jgi:hypothetical protein